MRDEVLHHERDLEQQCALRLAARQLRGRDGFLGAVKAELLRRQFAIQRQSRCPIARRTAERVLVDALVNGLEARLGIGKAFIEAPTPQIYR